MNPNCQKIVERLPDYLEGTAGVEGEARIRAHLETCPECRELVDSLRLLHGAMEQTPVEEHLDPIRRAKIVETARESVVRARRGLFDRILERFDRNTQPASSGFPWLLPLARLALFIILPLTATIVITMSMQQRPMAAYLGNSLYMDDSVDVLPQVASKSELAERDEFAATAATAPRSAPEMPSEAAKSADVPKMDFYHVQYRSGSAGPDNTELYRRLANDKAPAAPAKPEPVTVAKAKAAGEVSSFGRQVQTESAARALDRQEVRYSVANSATPPPPAAAPASAVVGQKAAAVGGDYFIVNGAVADKKSADSYWYLADAEKSESVTDHRRELSVDGTARLEGERRDDLLARGSVREREAVDQAGKGWAGVTTVSGGTLHAGRGEALSDLSKTLEEAKSSAAEPVVVAKAGSGTLMAGVSLAWDTATPVSERTRELRTDADFDGDKNGRATDFGLLTGEAVANEQLATRGRYEGRVAGGRAGAAVATTGKDGKKRDNLAPARGAVTLSLLTDAGGAVPGDGLISADGGEKDQRWGELKTALPKPAAVGTPVPLNVPNLESTVAQVATREYNVPKSTMDRFKEGDRYDAFGTYAADQGIRAPSGTTMFYDAETEKLQVTSEPATLGKLEKAIEGLRAGQADAPAKTDAPRPAPPRKPAGFNPYVEAAEDAFSTFGIDVDTASYTLTRRALQEGNWPDPEHVRTEEIVNAFDYDYTPPATGAFSIDTQLAPSPFRAPLDLLKVGIRGRVIGRDAKKPAVLTVVLDTSGSMDTPDRLGRIRTALRLLVDRLQPQDTIAIVGFNDTPRLLLDRVNGANKQAILDAIDSIGASGSTQLEGGLRLGYEVAARGFVAGGANRVLLLSDGVANLGAATAEQILAAVESQRKQGIYLTVLGFGSGNYDDAMLMQLADKGDGAYAFVDSDAEAQRLLVDDWEQTLHVIAKDVKIQVEFNPERVRRWRQIGYEKRHLTREQFRDDTVDAGEVGSGQSVTALYDLDLTGDSSQPIATVRVRYKDPDTGRVTELEHRVTNAHRIPDFSKAPPRFRVAVCAAELAEKLRLSPYAEATELSAVTAALRPAAMELRLDQRVQELLRLIETAAGLGR